MRRAAKLVFPYLKFGVISAATVTTLGYAYLQYINSKVGPLIWNKDEVVNVYKSKYVCSESQATRMYYSDLFDFSTSRVLYYLFYKSSCDDFNKRIAEQSIKNYEQEDIFNNIQKAGPIAKNKSAHSAIFEKIRKIRAKNKENNQVRTYLIKKIQELQMLMRTTVNPTIKEESKAKVDKIYKYVLQAGLFFKDPQFVKFAQTLPNIEKKYPNDYFYRILII